MTRPTVEYTFFSGSCWIEALVKDGVCHSGPILVLELDKEDLGLPLNSGINVSDLVPELHLHIADQPRDLLVCVERSLGRTCRAELHGVTSPHMYVTSRAPSHRARSDVHAERPPQGDDGRHRTPLTVRRCRIEGRGDHEDPHAPARRHNRRERRAQPRVRGPVLKRRPGVPIDLTELKPQHIEELIDQLDEVTIDVDDPDGKVQLFCE
ncbi:hypothetical protein [Streptomyces sp. NPDC002403]